MSSFETSGTVEEHGRVLIAGVPFAPGTEVDITISPKVRSADEVKYMDDEALAGARRRMRELFPTIKGFRNSPRIARDELYERGRVH